MNVILCFGEGALPLSGGDEDPEVQEILARNVEYETGNRKLEMRRGCALRHASFPVVCCLFHISHF
jgi:hypothetical protein